MLISILPNQKIGVQTIRSERVKAVSDNVQSIRHRRHYVMELLIQHGKIRATGVCNDHRMGILISSKNATLSQLLLCWTTCNQGSPSYLPEREMRNKLLKTPER